MTKIQPKRLHNDRKVKERRRTLRRRLTPAEATLWRALKNSQLDGRKFRRQHSVGPFILDFYCVEEWLAVELDGQVHRNDMAEIYDARRSAYLRRAGIKVIRFENFLVFDDMRCVLHQIKRFFGWKATTPSVPTTTPSVPTEDVGPATPPNQEGSFRAKNFPTE